MEAVYINPVQIKRRLLTHEDKKFYRIHAILGSYCMMNFITQMYFIFTNTDYNILDNKYMPYIIIPHFALHISSFEFILSSKRNLHYNIIWPEMRWHSLLFAYRSLLSIVASYIDFYPEVIKIVIVFMTFILADIVTQKLKSNESTTMRDNKWPEYIPKQYVYFHNILYSVSQFAATLVCLYANANMVFLTLIAIQTAPFGMTLIRKGIIKSLGWHLSYSISLLIPVLYSFKCHLETIVFQNPGFYYLFPSNHVILSRVIAVTLLRIIFRMNKYAIWVIIVLSVPPRIS